MATRTQLVMQVVADMERLHRFKLWLERLKLFNLDLFGDVSQRVVVACTSLLNRLANSTCGGPVLDNLPHR